MLNILSGCYLLLDNSFAFSDVLSSRLTIVGRARWNSLFHRRQHDQYSPNAVSGDMKSAGLSFTEEPYENWLFSASESSAHTYNLRRLRSYTERALVFSETRPILGSIGRRGTWGCYVMQPRRAGTPARPAKRAWRKCLFRNLCAYRQTGGQFRDELPQHCRCPMIPAS